MCQRMRWPPNLCVLEHGNTSASTMVAIAASDLWPPPTAPRGGVNFHAEGNRKVEVVSKEAEEVLER